MRRMVLRARSAGLVAGDELAVVAQGALKVRGAVEGGDLRGEEVLNRLHVLLAVQQGVFAGEQAGDKGFVVLLLGKHFVQQTDGLGHQRMIGVGAAGVAPFPARVVVAQGGELFEDEAHQPVLVLGHVHHVQILAQKGARVP